MKTTSRAISVRQASVSTIRRGSEHPRGRQRCPRYDGDLR